MQVKNRHLPNWQTLKLVLSSLIVFNFYLNVNSNTKPDYSALTEILDWTLIPMFVFIAAYTSKGISWQNWRINLIPSIIIYFTFQTAGAIILYLTKQLTFEEYLFFPQNGVWFFLAVPIWQSVFLLLPSFVKDKITMLFIIFLLAIAIAFLSINNLADKTGFYSILKYFPFFVMAYFFDDQKIQQLRQKTFLIVPITIITIIIYVYSRVEIKSELIYLSDGVTLINNIFTYIFESMLSIFILIAIICASPSTTRFVKIANNALGVYLIHPIICFFLLTLLNWLKIEAGLSLLILLTLSTIILALFLAKNSIIHWFLSPKIR